jgi:hypothetical protein
VKSVDSKFSTIIPVAWGIERELYLEFCVTTRSHIITLLRNTEDGADVSALLKALQTSLRFEQEMRHRFEESSTGFNSRISDGDDREGVRIISQSQTRTVLVDPMQALINERGLNATEVSISSVFDRFLGPYVKLERNNLEELLHRLEQEEDTPTASTLTNSGSGSSTPIGAVYGSATQMFVFIKTSIKRCTALSNAFTFLALTKEFKSCMVQYAESLRLRLPIPTGVHNPVYKLGPGAEVSICYIINTCEYCADVVPTLGKQILLLNQYFLVIPAFCHISFYRIYHPKNNRT